MDRRRHEAGEPEANAGDKEADRLLFASNEDQNQSHARKRYGDIQVGQSEIEKVPAQNAGSQSRAWQEQGLFAHVRLVCVTGFVLFGN
jgi:hypothetical protein